MQVNEALYHKQVVQENRQELSPVGRVRLGAHDSF